MKATPSGLKDETLPAAVSADLPAVVEQEVEKQVVVNAFCTVWEMFKIFVSGLFLGFLPSSWVEKKTNYPGLAKFEASLVEMGVLLAMYNPIFSWRLPGFGYWWSSELPWYTSVYWTIVVVLLALALLRFLVASILLFGCQFDAYYGPISCDGFYWLVDKIVNSKFLNSLQIEVKQKRIQKLIEQKKAKELER